MITIKIYLVKVVFILEKIKKEELKLDSLYTSRIIKDFYLVMIYTNRSFWMFFNDL